jgi:hypothetical protein
VTFFSPDNEVHGPIVFIAAAGGEVQNLPAWTSDWLAENHEPEPTVYLCSGLATSRKRLAESLRLGNPPALVVIDHGEGADPEAAGFGSYLRACIPEAWIVELVESEHPLPHDLDRAFIVPKPVTQSAWENVLAFVLQRSQSPQWSEVE